MKRNDARSLLRLRELPKYITDRFFEHVLVAIVSFGAFVLFVFASASAVDIADAIAASLLGVLWFFAFAYATVVSIKLYLELKKRYLT